MEKIILSKELKILLLKILKSGELTFNEAKAIIKPFENHLSIDEAKEFLKKLENEI
jgi:hypothetical protein